MANPPIATGQLGLVSARDKAGNVVVLPSDEAAAAYLRGDVELPGDARLTVRAPSGAAGTVPVSELRNAVASGYSVESPEKVRAEQDRERDESTGAQVVTGLESAGKALGGFVPVSEQIIALGHDVVGGLGSGAEYLERAKRREEANPNAALGGEVVGTVLPTIISGGMSMAGRLGARGAARALPGAAAEALGVSVADDVARLVPGSSLGQRLLRRTLSGAAGGAAESMPYAVGHAVEEYDKNPNATAERLLAGIGLETLAGGLAGGIFSGGGAALGEVTPVAKGALDRVMARIRPQDVEALAVRRFGHAAEGIGDRVVDLASVVSGGDKKAIRSLVQGDGEGILSAEARRRRAVAVYEAPEIRNRAVEQVRANLDQLLDATEMVSDEARGTLKTSQIRKLVTDADHVRAIASAKDEIAALRTRVESMVADKDAFGETKRLRDVLAATNLADRRVAQASQDFASAYKQGGLASEGVRDATAQTFAALDDLKRQVGRSRNTNGMMMPSGRDGAALGALEDIYEGMRVNLEDTTRWGQAGIAQKEINAKWSEMLGIQRQFRESLTRNVGRSERNPWMDAHRADPERVAKYIDSLTNPEKDLVHGFVKKYTASASDLIERIEKNYDLPAHMAGVADKSRAAVKGMQGALSDAEGAIVLRNQLRDLVQAESGGGLGGAAVLGMAGSMLGGEEAGTPLGILGAAVGLLAAPGRGVRRLAAIERIVGNARSKLDGRIASHVRSVVSGKRVPALLRARTAAAGVARGAEVVARKGALVMSMNEAEKIYDKTRDDIVTVANDREGFRARVEQSLAPLADDAPAVVKAAGDRAEAAMHFLASKLPKPRKRDMMTPQLGDDRPPADELLKFARYVNAVKDPGIMVEELERGELTAETVEAVRTVYPEVYAEVRQTVMTELANAKQPIPYQEKTRLALLLGIKPDASFEPDFGARMQQPASAPAQPKPRTSAPRGGGALKSVAKGYETTLNRLEI